MGWLKRLFGLEKPEDAQVNPTPNAISDNSDNTDNSENNDAGEQIPLERMGLNGEYDQSGLAKRVALAFDENPEFDDINTLYVAQLGTTVVLKGEAPSQDILDQLVEIARGVSGATDVTSDEVTVG